jgi:PP-loop superfamily ATP-utilizing enzyme
LREVKELIATHDPKQSSGSRNDRRKKNLQITRERLQLIDEKMQFLKRIRQSLVAVLEESQSARMNESTAECQALLEARKLEKRHACPPSVRRKKTS